MRNIQEVKQVDLPSRPFFDYLSSSGLQQHDRHHKFDFNSFVEVVLLVQRILQGELHETLLLHLLLALMDNPAQDSVYYLDAHSIDPVLVHPQKGQHGGRNYQEWIWTQLLGRYGEIVW